MLAPKNHKLEIAILSTSLISWVNLDKSENGGGYFTRLNSQRILEIQMG